MKPFLSFSLSIQFHLVGVVEQFLFFRGRVERFQLYDSKSGTNLTSVFSFSYLDCVSKSELNPVEFSVYAHVQFFFPF